MGERIERDTGFEAESSGGVAHVSPNIEEGEGRDLPSTSGDESSNVGQVDRALVQERASGTDIDATLARALEAATNAGQWDTVRVLAEELRARRLAAEPNVLALPMVRRPR